LACSSSGQSLYRELETPQKVEGLGPSLHCGDTGSNPVHATNNNYNKNILRDRAEVARQAHKFVTIFQ